MAALHLTKVAVGCGDLAALVDRMELRAAEGGAHLVTRYRPTRHVELVGGSVYWIIKHQIVARQTILGFEEAEGGRCRIMLADTLVGVRLRAKRAHQGWRYLTAGDAPADLGGDADGADMLPPHLAGELAALALI